MRLARGEADRLRTPVSVLQDVAVNDMRPEVDGELVTDFERRAEFDTVIEEETADDRENLVDAVGEVEIELTALDVLDMELVLQAVDERLGDVEAEMEARDDSEIFAERDPKDERVPGKNDAVPLTFAEAVGSREFDGEDVVDFERAADNDADKLRTGVFVVEAELEADSEETIDLDIRVDAVRLVETEADLDTPDETVGE